LIINFLNGFKAAKQLEAWSAELLKLIHI